jgi:site-specific recombinase XerD
MDRAIGRFLADLLAGRGFSPRTAEAYRRDLESWAAFLAGRADGRAPKVDELRPADVTLHLAHLTKAGRSARTVARHLAAIRSFARYLRRHGHAADWAAAVRGPRLPPPVPSFLTEAEMAALFRLDFGEGPEGLRDRAVIELLYATGIRLAELVGLNRDESLDLQRRRVRVLGKGNRERIVPFGVPAGAALRDYLAATAELPLADAGGRPLFLGRAGRRVSRRTVQRLVRHHLARVAARAGLSPHLLRHTVATHLLARMSRGEAAGLPGGAGAPGERRAPPEARGAADIRAVQELLGHVSLASTQVYTHVTVDRLRAALKAAHPRGEE